MSSKYSGWHRESHLYASERETELLLQSPEQLKAAQKIKGTGSAWAARIFHANSLVPLH